MPPAPEPTSIDLLRRASEGDAASFGVLYARFKPALLTRIRTMLGPETRRIADSEDFLNSVFLTLMRDLDGREQLGDEQLLRWMTAVARNNIRDGARRRHEQAFESLSTVLANESSSATPVSQAAHQERLHNLARVLEGLDERSREVLEMRFFEESSFAEIGARVGCSHVHARHLFYKALVTVGRRMPGVA